MNSRAPALIRTAMRNSLDSSLAPVTSSATCAARTRPAKSSEEAPAASDASCVSGMATATSPEETPASALCSAPPCVCVCESLGSASVVVRVAASISSMPPPADFLRKNLDDPGDLRIPLALAPLGLASSECGVCGTSRRVRNEPCDGTRANASTADCKSSGGGARSGLDSSHWRTSMSSAAKRTCPSLPGGRRPPRSMPMIAAPNAV
mmetsp:Transcript_11113/g.43321  ORF Transcript_11113/g.43321 Transcript_11113/m.43321 type:complete len:208 (-) Transcript_11113:2449-3072(-)